MQYQNLNKSLTFDAVGVLVLRAVDAELGKLQLVCNVCKKISNNIEGYYLR